MTQQTKDRRFEKAKKLLAKLKNSKERKPLKPFPMKRIFNRMKESTGKIIDGCVLMKSQLS